MGSRGLLLLALACVAVAAKGLELGDSAAADDLASASRKLLGCGGYAKKPHCCKVWDYDYCYCKEYKHGWYYYGGKCNYRDDGYKCPHCCEECDYHKKYCKRYKHDYYYEHGRCQKKAPSYGGSPTATASADATCRGRGCATKTHTSTSTTPYSSRSSSYSQSGK
eukprot:evm.model.scf_2264.1 EVM.evm.TU.scf_2264.1   scf_2264:14005-15816(+)